MVMNASNKIKTLCYDEYRLMQFYTFHVYNMNVETIQSLVIYIFGCT